MLIVKLLIGGKDLGSISGAEFVRTDPLSGEPATIAASAGVADASMAAAAAAAALPAWAALGPGERRARLNEAADLLETKGELAATLMTAETGAAKSWAHFNVHLAASILREAAAMTTHVGGEVVPSDVPGSLAMALRRPAGVVLGIAPWNAPIILGVRAVAMPLACGNTVILKGSENCPATHRLIASTLQEAGLGAGVVNYICHEPKDASVVVETLIAHSAVRRVNFTGSTHVGRLIGEMAARHLKPALLELGGKAPLVVFEDADLDAAVAATVFGAFANSGQICMSTERVIVHEKVADAFAAALVLRVKALSMGDPRQGDYVLGALISEAAVTRVQGLVADAVSRGARVLCGGETRGNIMAGLVVDHVTPTMRLFREESFGPQVSITRFNTETEALQLANHTDFGLSAAVFSRDIGRALEFSKRIDSGICHINGPTVHDEPQMPFGGTKESGFGRFGGKAAIDAFTELRWITIQTGARQYPF
jgi:benzaldehyde dehydrogenase (NAD)